jgi:starch synthase
VYLFSVGGNRGLMVVGNPSDDWNWMEELNRYMEVPRNHPGAFADIGFENDRYTTTILSADGPTVHAQLTHDHSAAAHGLAKNIVLPSYEANKLIVTYTLPESLPGLGIECGFSPDYLNLLRYGRSIMQHSETASCRGFHTREAAVFVHKNGGQVEWAASSCEEFGHGARITLYARDRQFSLSIEAIAQPEQESHATFVTEPETAALASGGSAGRGHKSDSS